MAAGGVDADIIILGGSHAGGECGFRLRQGGFAGSIALVSAESHLPYHRPPLSKAFLSGEASMESLLLRSPGAYEKAAIAWQPATVVTRIDSAGHRLHLENGNQLRYGRLVIATGGRARRLPVPGVDLAGIHSVRSIDDVEKLRPEFLPGKRLVIAGAGYIGLEVAAVAIKYGLDVEIVEFAPRVLARVAGPSLSAFYENAHRAAGVRFRFGTGVEAFLPAPSAPERVGGVHCTDGAELPADLVLVAAGLIPNVELAETAGLEVDNGIVVDEFCRTADADVLAIGDVANFPLPFLGGKRVRMESVPSALEQARVAASVLNGTPSAYNLVPWFWSDQYNLKLQSVGLSQGFEQEVQRPARMPEGFMTFYLKDDRMIAADCVNCVIEFNAAKRLVGERVPVSATALANPEVPLKSLLPVKAV
jgi:3-phenylpropionate/trans-cinnamate dioxygenase ferredoxin reductase subunit